MLVPAVRTVKADLVCWRVAPVAFLWVCTDCPGTQKGFSFVVKVALLWKPFPLPELPFSGF